MTHLWDELFVYVFIAWHVVKVGLVQHGSKDPGCVVPAGHFLQGAACQLGNAHVVVAVDLMKQHTDQKARRQHEMMLALCDAWSQDLCSRAKVEHTD